MSQVSVCRTDPQIDVETGIETEDLKTQLAMDPVDSFVRASATRVMAKLPGAVLLEASLSNSIGLLTWVVPSSIWEHFGRGTHAVVFWERA